MHEFSSFSMALIRQAYTNTYCAVTANTRIRASRSLTGRPVFFPNEGDFPQREDLKDKIKVLADVFHEDDAVALVTSLAGLWASRLLDEWLLLKLN